ncbi:hypothetical protein J31TS4_41700 [Paenibacillus sp. J31TS4]|uniref:DNA-3-methyladenine glycosylase n=1 Tax=Paenibacillus sp. J31TS4 TaxID=2807195 RepID=UPI001B03DB54|nr:DNA-3-methyladenine glycosylase [Paenibacillus sp. J31TS4]GIP40890.1 hypothetical protein J31TS4_41700 [Paenibacillus sp. J31TS4]
MKKEQETIQSVLALDVVAAAERLIGCRLVRHLPEGRIVIELTETEAYRGADDPASHAARGRTLRNEPMFGEPGRLYVYLSYGLHACMNVVTGASGEPGAVLLRAGRALEGIELIRANRPGISERQLMNGPGKLSRALAVDLSLNRYEVVADPDGLLQLELGPPKPSIRTSRIGITKGTDLLWRFVEPPAAR